MSNHLVSLAYTRKLGSLMRKSVLVLMADKASDDGSGIFASKQTIADELDCSKRAVIETIKGLLDDKILVEVGHRANGNGYTVEYAIQPDRLEALPMVDAHIRRQKRKDDQCTTVTGEPDAPVNEVHGRGECGSPEPFLNLSSVAKATSERARPKSKVKKSDDVELPEWLPTEAWHGFLEMRVALRKRLTPKGQKLAIGLLAKLRAAGNDPGEVLDRSTFNAWQGLFPLDRPAPTSRPPPATPSDTLDHFQRKYGTRPAG